MRVLILGVTGFAGRWLADELKRGGHEVLGAGRTLPQAASDAHDAPLAPPSLRGIALFRCDVTNARQVSDVLAEAAPNAVVLLAGLASPPAANRDPEAAFRVHVAGTVQVLREVSRLERDVRVLVVSSGEVYGPVPEDALPVAERAPLQPASIYAASKAAADVTAEAFAPACDVVRVRPFNHTGPGQSDDFVCPDFAAQVAAIATGRRSSFVEVGNLDVRRDFSDVRDIVRGYAAVLERGRRGEAYNLCSGRATPIREILTTLCDLAGIEPEIRSTPERQRKIEVPVVFGTSHKAEAELGWGPQIPLRTTLAELLAWKLGDEATVTHGVQRIGG